MPLSPLHRPAVVAAAPPAAGPRAATTARAKAVLRPLVRRALRVVEAHAFLDLQAEADRSRDRLDQLGDTVAATLPTLHDLEVTEAQLRADGDAREQTLRQVLGQVENLRREATLLGDAIAPASGLEKAPARMAELRERIYGMERQLRAITVGAPAASRPLPDPAASGSAAPSEAASATAPQAAPATVPTTDVVAQPTSALFDYTGFERRFRGDPEQVVADLWDRYGELLAAHAPVVDLGCGRAELLERLAADGVAVHGVDSDPMLVADARARGLDVELADAVAWLEAQPERSLGSIIATHVVEHLPLDVLIRLLELAASRLAPGGVFVAETPNPTSLIVLGNSYLLDPTHVRPLHPALLAFLCEGAGFRGVRLEFWAPATGYHLPTVEGADAPVVAAQVNAAFHQLNQTLFGPQDYAVVATSPETDDPGDA